MTRSISILQIITVLLLLLWIPAALDKFIDFESFKQNIYRQPFNYILATAIVYSLPPIEIGTALLLVFPKLRLWGFILSTLLMTLFTGYTLLVLQDTWEKLPCSCGLIISNMGWNEHLWFNLSFLVLSIIGWNRQYISGKRS